MHSLQVLFEMFCQPLLMLGLTNKVHLVMFDIHRQLLPGVEQVVQCVVGMGYGKGVEEAEPILLKAEHLIFWSWKYACSLLLVPVKL